MVAKALSLVATLLTVPAAAWQADVHQQIGFLAEALLQTAPLPVLPILSQLLEPEYEGSIGRAGGWADDYKDTPEGKKSYQWHWITSNDRAPEYCNVYYNRDCGKAGCVVSAIEEQSAIVTECARDLKEGYARPAVQEVMQSLRAVNATCSHALKWVVHFIGDIAQPLHASGRGLGGNLVNVTFGGETVRMHAAWDRYFIYYDANVTSFPNTTLHPFFASLASRIFEDDLLEPRSEWFGCDSTNLLKPGRARNCIMNWARDTNQWNCDFVYGKPGWDKEDLKLNGYAHEAFPIIQMQVSKAALRLAVWLFGIVHPQEFNGAQELIQHFKLNQKLGSLGTGL